MAGISVSSGQLVSPERRLTQLLSEDGAGCPSAREESMPGSAHRDTESGNPTEQVRRVLSYHRRSKHHLHRTAEGPGFLDWANQPDPFRTFTGAPRIDLPLLADAAPASYGAL